MEIGFSILLAVAGGLAAALAHEATHAAAAYLLGREGIRVDWLGLDCYWRVERADWRETAIGIAPFVVGLLGAGLFFVLGGRPTLPLVVIWAVYINNIWADARVRSRLETPA